MCLEGGGVRKVLILHFLVIKIKCCQVRDNLVLAVQRQRLIREGKLRAVVCIFIVF